MIFKCRDLQLNVWEFEALTVSKAIETIEAYEQKNNTAVRAFDKANGWRIIGGIMQPNNR